MAAVTLSKKDRPIEDPSPPSSPQKRQKIENPLTIIASGVIQIKDPDQSLRNVVWLNPEDFQQYHCLDETISNTSEATTYCLDMSDPTEKSLSYVRVAGQVYQVALATWIPQKQIGLNEVQERDCFPHPRPVYLVPITRFDPSQSSPIETMNLHISLLNPTYGNSLQHLLDVSQLDTIFKKNFDGQIFREGQSILLQLRSATFKVSIIGMPNKNSDDDRMNLTWSETSYFRQLNKDSQLNFSTDKNQGLILINQIISPWQIQTISCQLAVSNETNQSSEASTTTSLEREYEQLEKKTKEPLILDKREITELIQQKVKNRLFILRETISIKTKNGNSLTVSFEKVDITNISMQSFEKASNYIKGFKLDDTVALTFKGPNIILVDPDRPFDVIDAIELHLIGLKRKDPKEKNTTWIKIEELQKGIENRLVVEEQLFKVDVSLGTVYIQWSRPEPAKEGPVWRIEKRTKMAFTCDPSFPVVLLQQSGPLRVKNLSFRVTFTSDTLDFLSCCSREKELLIIEEERLIAEVKSRFPKIFTSKNELIVKTNTNKRLTLRIDSFDLETNSTRETASEQLGLLVETTELNFESKSPDLFIQKKEKFTQKSISLDAVASKLKLGGMEQQLDTIIKTILLSRIGPLKEEALRRGIKPIKGLLLVGPPGTGKTTLARQLGELLGCDEERISLHSGPDFLSKWHGESEQNIRKIFAPALDSANLLGDKSPFHVMIVDEIDALLPIRGLHTYSSATDSIVNQFLASMDGLNQHNNFLVVGTTNNTKKMDPAILRSGRFEILEIGLPETKEQRLEILTIHTQSLKEQKLLSEDVDLGYLAEITQGWSGADLEALVRRANDCPIYRLSLLEEMDTKALATHPSGLLCQADFMTAWQTMKDSI